MTNPVELTVLPLTILRTTSLTYSLWRLALVEHGVEYPITGGRIDLLAKGKDGRFVVIELKLSRGRNKTLGQILHYMGWVDQELGNGPCRGYIVANEIPADLRLAVNRVPGVKLAEYKLSFAIQTL
jgi:RecB family endonuclease NucS